MDNASTADGTIVKTYTSNSTNAQRWKLILKTAARQASASGQPTSKKLAKTQLDVYPNPFTSQTTLRYELAQPATVRLEVVDALGRRVALLVHDEGQTAGQHQATFKAESLTSGTYWVVLKTGEAVQSQSLLLVR